MRVRIGLGLAVLAAAGLAGCSDVDRVIDPLELRTDVKMTPAQARADLAKRSDDLQTVIGGEWENRDNDLASGCADDKGFYYYGQRSRLEPVTDIATAADHVETWWKKQGYTVKHQVFRNDHLLHGVAPNGMTIDLNLQDGQTYFSTDGTCLPGDWAAIRHADGERIRRDMKNTPTPTP